MFRTLLVVVIALAAGCGAPQGRVVTPDELARLEAEQRDAAAVTAPRTLPPPIEEASESETTAGTSEEYLTKSREFDERARDLSRRREDYARDVQDLDDERARLAIEHESERSSERVELADAERGHRIATEDLTHFREVERTRRLREEELEVRASHDRLLETREELAQLEIMYRDADLGDAAAEIVLNRSRRRLALAEQEHALLEERASEVALIELPRREEELLAELEAKRVALENARREIEAATLARRAALRELEGKEAELAREAADIEREEGELAQDRRLWEQELADAPVARLHARTGAGS